MREYSVTGKNITLTAAANPLTLVIINPGAARVIRILRAWCSQNGSTTSAQQGIQLATKATAFPTVTSVTPQKTKTSDQASAITGGTAGAAGTAGINATAEGAGAVATLYPDSFNVLTPWNWTPQWAANEMYDISGADSLAFILQLTTAFPGSSYNFGVTYAELG